MIIAISGKSDSGKDTVGKIIQWLIDQDGLVTLNGEPFGENTLEDCVYFINSGEKLEFPEETSWQIKKFADKLKDVVCLLIGCTRQDLESQEFKSKELGEEWDKYELHWSDGWDGQTNIVSKNFDKNDFLDKKGEFWGKLGKRMPMTPRLLLQLLGTECGRQIIHPNIWVNSLFNNYKKNVSKYEKVCPNCKYEDGTLITCPKCHPVKLEPKSSYPNWIITDLRFPNELKAIKDRGGITIRIDREENDLEKASNHAHNELVKKYGSDEILWNGENYKEEYQDEFNDLYDKYLNKSFHESENALDNAIFDYHIDNSGTIEELIEKVREILIELKLI